LPFSNHTLANGLQIVAETNPQAHTIGLGYFVRTGSRDETPEVAGVSHFLEHMTFKGTPSRTAEDVNREFDEMGADHNAFTSEEATVYHAAVLPEYQDQCVALLTDIMRPSLREDDFETEKQVILEEIHMYDDQPPFGADDKLKAAYFGDHPLAGSVLGSPETVEALTADQMRDYFRRRYSPGNMVLAGAGKIDFDALVKQAESLCGDWQPQDADRDTPPAPARTGMQLIERPNSAQQYILQMSPGPSCEDEDRFAAKLLQTIVGDDSGSRLYWDLVDPGRAEQAALWHQEFEGTGVFSAFLSCDPGEAAENLDLLSAIYRTVEQEGLTAAELQQAKSKFKSRFVIGGERPRSWLMVVGLNWLIRGQYRSVKQYVATYDAVTLDQVADVLAKYPLSHNTTVTVGPLKELVPVA